MGNEILNKLDIEIIRIFVTLADEDKEAILSSFEECQPAQATLVSPARTWLVVS